MMGRKKKREMEEAVQDHPVEQDPVENEDAVDAPEAPDAQAAETEPRDDWKDKYLRVLAELDNMRKRVERDRAQSHKYALEDVLRNLLPVLDALHYAIASEGDAETLREGVELAIKDAHRILGEKGFTPIEALHKPFDPRWHEAVGMQPSEEHPAGTVLVEERAGYLLHDRVLRPALVHISVAPPKAAAKEDESDADV